MARFIVWSSPFPYWPASSPPHSRRLKLEAATMAVLPLSLDCSAWG